MSRITKNEWMPENCFLKERDFPDEDDFLVRTEEESQMGIGECHIGIGYKHPDGICYTLIKYGTVKNSITYFPTDKNYQLPKEILVFAKYKKNSPLWYKVKRHVSWRSDMPESKLILGYNKEWEDKKNYASGIRLGYLADNHFHSLSYNNEKDQYFDRCIEGDDYDRTDNDALGLSCKYYNNGKGDIKGWRPNMPEYWRFLDEIS